MSQAAKFPAVIAALADFFAEQPDANSSELILNADITATSLAIVATTAIPGSWPATGRFIMDSEVIEYASFTGSTFTIASTAKRGLETGFGSGAAAIHTAGAVIGNFPTAQAWAQIVAEIIAVETAITAGVENPNLVLNSDFGRRTVFGLAMPETFADTSGYTVVSGSGGVASNIFTATAINTEIAWCNQSFVWRDGRASATFKAVATAGQYFVAWRNTASLYIRVSQNAGNFAIITDGATQATTAQALTLNRWYWIEVEQQGGNVIAKLYDTGGTVPGVTKAASTLLVTLGGTGTVSAQPIRANHISVFSDQNGAQWGGVATGNGGVYVETWLPESWLVTFSGTLGGQAIGYDESVDAGPLAKQWAIRTYIPATSRQITFSQGANVSAHGDLPPSVPITSSIYCKTSGASGAGLLLYYTINLNQAGTDIDQSHTQGDGQVTNWTRISQAWTPGATTRGFRVSAVVNGSSNATGTLYLMLPQLEQGSAATAWRNAPADDAPVVWDLARTLAANISTTLGSPLEVDSRDVAGNLFMPWDAVLDLSPNFVWISDGANINYCQVTVDGVSYNLGYSKAPAANVGQVFNMHRKIRVAAGKHRVAATWYVGAGTGTVDATSGYCSLAVTATRGK